MRRAIRPSRELHRQWPVQPQLMLDFGDRLRRGIRPGQIDRQIPRQAGQREADHQDCQTDQNRQKQGAKKEPDHSGSARID